MEESRGVLVMSVSYTHLLKEELKKITDKDIQINIFEVKRPELDAVIVRCV